jgi:hypothetical protein
MSSRLGSQDMRRRTTPRLPAALPMAGSLQPASPVDWHGLVVAPLVGAEATQPKQAPFPHDLLVCSSTRRRQLWDRHGAPGRLPVRCLHAHRGFLRSASGAASLVHYRSPGRAIGPATDRSAGPCRPRPRRERRERHPGLSRGRGAWQWGRQPYGWDVRGRRGRPLCPGRRVVCPRLELALEVGAGRAGPAEGRLDPDAAVAVVPHGLVSLTATGCTAMVPGLPGLPPLGPRLHSVHPGRHVRSLLP